MESKTVQTLKAHLALNVRSVEASIGFYRKMFGIEPCKVRTGYAKFDVANPPLNLTLNENPFGERGALSHLGVQVASTEDVLALRDRWREAGLSTFDEMQTNCCYAIQDKTWVTDPDGNNWEAFVVLEDNLAETTLCCVADAAAGADAQGAALCSPTGAGESKAAPIKLKTSETVKAESKTAETASAETAAAAASCCATAENVAAASAPDTAVASSCCAPATAEAPVSIGR
ncbi:MAG TPA: ArsI/CadI family heavy metal resistance metalloenzyme [Pyrinomonadaceae bacterium]